jgi:7-cyano-7-deazaguanine synthase in queuosine biosynthesis
MAKVLAVVESTENSRLLLNKLLEGGFKEHQEKEDMIEEIKAVSFGSLLHPQQLINVKHMCEELKVPHETITISVLPGPISLVTYLTAAVAHTDHLGYNYIIVPYSAEDKFRSKEYRPVVTTLLSQLFAINTNNNITIYAPFIEMTNEEVKLFYEKTSSL